jgi:hypothetical protein
VQGRNDEPPDLPKNDWQSQDQPSVQCDSQPCVEAIERSKGEEIAFRHEIGPTLAELIVWSTNEFEHGIVEDENCDESKRYRESGPNDSRAQFPEMFRESHHSI